MARFVFYCNTGFYGADHREVVEIPDDELSGNVEEQEEKIERWFNNWLLSQIETGWHKYNKGENEE